MVLSALQQPQPPGCACANKIEQAKRKDEAGRGMSFNICRGTLGSLAMFTAGENREG